MDQGASAAFLIIQTSVPEWGAEKVVIRLVVFD